MPTPKPAPPPDPAPTAEPIGAENLTTGIRALSGCRLGGRPLGHLMSGIMTELPAFSHIFGPRFNITVLAILGCTAQQSLSAPEDSEQRTISVKGSTGSLYEVQIGGSRGSSCSCKGYQFRGNCRHIAEAESQIAA